MSDEMSLERMVASVMAETVSGTVPDRMIDDVLSVTGRMRPAPRWLALLKEPPMRADSQTAVGMPARRLVLMMTIILVAIALAAAVVGASLLLRPPATTSADWPMFRGDAARTGVAIDGPVGRPVLRWRYQAAGAVSGNISIVGDLVFAPSDDGTLHALGLADGTERWAFTPPGGFVSGPAAAGGRIYVSDRGGAFYALDQTTGQQRWKSSSYHTPSGATIDGGLVYFGTADGLIVALDAGSGAERWRATVSPTSGAANAPAVADGRVYAGTAGGGFVAVDASNGALVWRVDTGSDGTGTAIVSDGVAYIGSTADNGLGGHLRAVDAATGRVLWQTDGMNFSPTVAAGVVYTATSSGVVGARDATTGAERWRFQVHGVARAPAVAHGIVYVAADTEHRVYALEASSGRELWHFDVDGSNECCIAVAKGSVFVGTTPGGVYDIGGDGTTISPAPPAAPTPTTAPTSTASGAATALPSTPPSPVKLVWKATAPGGAMNPTAMTLDPKGRLWAADTANDRFAIFKPDGTFVEFWGTSGAGDGQFKLTRANGDPYGALAFEPDGSFFVLDVGNRRVQKFDANRHFVRAWGGFADSPGKYIDPVGIAIGPDGKLHVLDDVRKVIETYDPDGTVVGSMPAFPDIGIGTDGANALAMDRDGNLYVSAVGPTEVVRLDPSGKLTGRFGSPTSGPGELTEQPTGMAIDAGGRLLVAQGPQRGDRPGVLVFDPDGRYLTGWGSVGTKDGDLGFPWGVVLDKDANVYVSDYGPADLGLEARIQKFGPLPQLGP